MRHVWTHTTGCHDPSSMSLRVCQVELELLSTIFCRTNWESTCVPLLQVNDKLQTSNKSIFAVGDVCTQYHFTHVAGADCF